MNHKIPRLLFSLRVRDDNHGYGNVRSCACILTSLFCIPSLTADKIPIQAFPVSSQGFQCPKPFSARIFKGVGGKYGFYNDEQVCKAGSSAILDHVQTCEGPAGTVIIADVGGP